jgi:hypothetical protein
VLEVQDQSNWEFGNSQVIQHLPAFVVGDPVNTLGIHHHFPESDQVGSEFADVFALVKHLKSPLLVERNAATFEFHDQGILVKLFVQSMPEFIQHLERTTNDRMGFLFARVSICLSGTQIGKIICVHLRSSAVKSANKNASHGGCEALAFIPDWRDERYSVVVVAQSDIMAAG